MRFWEYGATPSQWALRFDGFARGFGNWLLLFSEHELVGPVRLHGLFTRAVVVP